MLGNGFGNRLQMQVRVLLAPLFLFLSHIILAQTTISVKDNKGLPVQEAYVIYEGIVIGKTDKAGQFVSKNSEHFSKLTIFSMGYNSENIQIDKQKENYEVILNKRFEQLKTITITNYSVEDILDSLKFHLDEKYYVESTNSNYNATIIENNQEILDIAYRQYVKENVGFVRDTIMCKVDKPLIMPQNKMTNLRILSSKGTLNSRGNLLYSFKASSIRYNDVIEKLFTERRKFNYNKEDGKLEFNSNKFDVEGYIEYNEDFLITNFTIYSNNLENKRLYLINGKKSKYLSQVQKDVLTYNYLIKNDRAFLNEIKETRITSVSSKEEQLIFNSQTSRKEIY